MCTITKRQFCATQQKGEFLCKNQGKQMKLFGAFRTEKPHFLLSLIFYLLSFI